MDKNDYSIEYSHIYTNEAFSQEHELSAKKLISYLPKLNGFVFTLDVFIDNYNSTEDLLDIQGFLTELGNLGLKPDFYAFEADMAKYRDDLLLMIKDKKIKSSYERYINGKDKLPCSFMTTIWYFLRLGVLPVRDGVIHQNNGKKFRVAKQLINILPERFRSVEMKALELVEATEYSDLVKNIDFIFYDK